MIKKFIVFIFVPICILSCVLQENCYSNTNLKIGVVDISKVFKEYLKRKDLDIRLKDLEKEYESTVKDKQNSLVKLAEEIELLDMGSKVRKKKEELLQKKSIDLEVYTKFAEQSLLEKYKEYFEEIYIDVKNEVKKYGSDHGFDLIFKNEEPEIKSNEINDLQFKIGIKSVLYYSNAVDITIQIIKKINGRYSSNIKR